MVSARLQVTTLRVITCPTGCSGAGAALGQHAYDVPLRDDTRDPLVGADNDQRANATCRQQLTADARSAVGSMVATSVPLLSRIAVTIMVASQVRDATGALGPSLENPVPQPNFNRTETLKIINALKFSK